MDTHLLHPLSLLRQEDLYQSILGNFLVMTEQRMGTKAYLYPSTLPAKGNKDDVTKDTTYESQIQCLILERSQQMYGCTVSIITTDNGHYKIISH